MGAGIVDDFHGGYFANALEHVFKVAFRSFVGKVAHVYSLRLETGCLGVATRSCLGRATLVFVLAGFLSLTAGLPLAGRMPKMPRKRCHKEKRQELLLYLGQYPPVPGGHCHRNGRPCDSGDGGLGPVFPVCGVETYLYAKLMIMLVSCRIFMLHAIGSVRRIAGVFRFRKENQKCGCPVPRSTVRAWSDKGRSGCVRCQSGGLTRIPMHTKPFLPASIPSFWAFQLSGSGKPVGESPGLVTGSGGRNPGWNLTKTLASCMWFTSSFTLDAYSKRRPYNLRNQ